MREVARQGIIPYPSFFASTQPLGTPLNALIVYYIVSVFVIVAPPAEDAFNFLVNLKGYAHLVRTLSLRIDELE